MFGETDVSSRGVQLTRELTRILNLPRRNWTDAEANEFALELTSVIKRPGGTMTLRPIQAMALLDAGTLGGLAGPILVGGGKTLITGLCPYVMRSRRPMLITRANLRDKTKREFRDLAQHWPIPNFIRIVSYEELGRANNATLLSDYQPDLIMGDEAHRLKNPKAAVTRRVARWMTEAPDTMFVALSGTLTRRSLTDYAHLIAWALKAQNAPVPMSFSEREDWGKAIDEHPNQTGAREVTPGALLSFCTPEERLDPDQVSAARRGFRRRLTDTPGIVATSSEGIGASLSITALEIDVSPKIDEAFQILRDTWTTPDEWPISDPMSLWRHARELAMGFYYKWDPRPPKSWIEPRKEWAAMCRYILANNKRNLDSELQVLNAVDQGHYPDAAPLLEAWRRVKASFVPNTVPVWLDDSVIDAAARWAMAAPGIVWCEHVAFAERLAWKTNLSYYGTGGQDAQGRPIESHDPGSSLIASEASNAEGRNLQAWNRNLVTSCFTSGTRAEQLLGRTHRPGQMSDEVTAEILVTSIEHVLAFEQARRDSRYQQDILGQPQKLLFADVVFPGSEEVSSRTGARWKK